VFGQPLVLSEYSLVNFAVMCSSQNLLHYRHVDQNLRGLHREMHLEGRIVVKSL
jgi:hypothetical protein